MAFDPIFLFELAIILFAAKVLGEAAERLRLSHLVGEMAAGLVLGPILHFVRPGDFLGQMANLGMLFIAFLIGTSIKLEQGRKDAAEGAAAALGASAISFIAGAVAGMYFFGSVEAGIFTGAVLMFSSTSLGIKSLVDAGDIRSRAHDTMVSISKFSDIIAVSVIALLSNYFILNGQIAAFAVFIAAAAIIIAGSRHIGKAVSAAGRLKDEHIMLSVPLAAIFIIAFFSDTYGIAAVSGAFLAGAAMSRSSVTESSVMPKMKILTYGFFAPLFFAYSVALVEFHTELVLTVAAISLISILSAFAAYSAISMRLGFGRRDGMVIGASKIARGELSVMALSIALSAAIITNAVYSVVIASVVVTAIAGPVVVKVLYRR